MSREYRRLGLLGLFEVDEIELSVLIAEMKVGIVAVRYQAAYKCLRHVAAKHGVDLEDIEVEEYYGSMSFYASLLRFHNAEWIPPLLESAWSEYENQNN